MNHFENSPTLLNNRDREKKKQKEEEHYQREQLQQCFPEQLIKDEQIQILNWVFQLTKNPEKYPMKIA